jgi:DNA-directed RNA polymerase III subunit RPC2
MSLLEPAERRAHHHAGASIPAALTEQLKSITAPHIDSFDYFLDDAQGMQLSVASLPMMHLDADEANARPRIEYWIDEATIGKPSRSGVSKANDTRLFPNECREGGGTYAAPLYVTVKYRVGGDDQ